MVTKTPAQPGCGPRTWRYQAVWRTEPSGDLYFTVCEIYLDEGGQLTNWITSAEHTPIGNDIADLQNELVRMYVDSACWKPVAFASLHIGMTFERAITKEQRAGVAQMFDAFRELALPQPEPVSPGTAPNTESSPNTVPGAPGEAGRG